MKRLMILTLMPLLLTACGRFFANDHWRRCTARIGDVVVPGVRASNFEECIPCSRAIGEDAKGLCNE